ncbi:uncharacterized protein LOC144139635 [Haemaphysalis longicornis]
MCVNRDGLNFEESLRACEDIGMSLLSEEFSTIEYENLFSSYEEYAFQKEVTSYWVRPLKRNNTTCSAIVRHRSTITPYSSNCTQKLRAVCIGPALVMPPTTLQGTCPPSSFIEEAQHCDEKFKWTKDENSSTCVTHNFLIMWEHILESQDIERAKFSLASLVDDITSPADVRKLPTFLKELLPRILILFRDVDNTRKSDLGRSFPETVAELVSRVMLKTHAWNGIPQEERRDTSDELDNIVQEFSSELARLVARASNVVSNAYHSER